MQLEGERGKCRWRWGSRNPIASWAHQSGSKSILGQATVVLGMARWQIRHDCVPAVRQKDANAAEVIVVTRSRRWRWRSRCQVAMRNVGLFKVRFAFSPAKGCGIKCRRSTRSDCRIGHSAFLRQTLRFPSMLNFISTCYVQMISFHFAAPHIDSLTPRDPLLPDPLPLQVSSVRGEVHLTASS